MKTFLNIILKAFVVLVGLVILYLVLGFLIPYIKVPEQQTQDEKNIQAYILTNGVHTDIVLPLKTKTIDWSQKFPFKNTVSQDENFNYLSLGWGDKGFYLDTPTWSQLKPSTAFKAAFWLGDAAVHATYYKEMTVSDSVKSFKMTEKQYQNLIQYIDHSLDKNKNGEYIFIKTNAVYGKNDAFYEAKGSYSFLFTCNTWANNALKAAGQKAAIWTPSDRGIFLHYQ